MCRPPHLHLKHSGGAGLPWALLQLPTGFRMGGRAAEGQAESSRGLRGRGGAGVPVAWERAAWAFRAKKGESQWNDQDIPGPTSALKTLPYPSLNCLLVLGEMASYPV